MNEDLIKQMVGKYNSCLDVRGCQQHGFAL
jgi:hypothetical protein